ncbi:TonB-dependent receptor [candidate division KSB1 bacterium]|nr:MAG: TonB-dependent receptor [candidate division KSB1 bacterium]
MKVKIIRWLSLVAICGVALLFYTAARAGTVGKIAGRVIDSENGEPVIGAAIMVEGTESGAAADINGDYYILNVPPGMVNLRCSALGYAPRSIQGVQVISDQTSTVDFSLQPASIQGEEVIIIAERKLVELDRTFATQTIAAQDMGTLPITNLNQVVELQAGIVDGHFRGGRKNEVLYLVDGVSITDVYDNAQGTQVDNRVVEELQVISGTFNAEYGQAMSGIVNIVTKEGGKEYHGSVTTEFGDYLSDHDELFMNIGDVTPMAIQDYGVSLYGPVPKIRKLSFYASGRYLKDSGWMYGRRRWIPVWLVYPNGMAMVGHGDNSYVEMNRNWESFGHVKLSYDLSSRMKLSYSNLFSSRNYRDFSQDWKFCPDGDLRRYRDGRTNIVKFNHAVSGSAFYELGFTNTFTEYHHYVYEDPYDSRYAHPMYEDANPAYTMNLAGTNLNRFRRWTQTNQLMGNLSWQVNKLHLAKLGFDVKLHDILYDDVYLVSANPGQVIDPSATADDPKPLYFKPVVEDIQQTSHDRYLNHPSEYAVYLQDKFELPYLIVNAGLRIDYFEPDGKVLTDPKDPNVYSPLLTTHVDDPLDERLSYWYKDAKAKWALSPRIGIAYPMSDVGVFHFAYGHFVQRPTFERMYANPKWELASGVGLNTVMGNPDLKMEETTTYEFGFQQQLLQNVALNTTIFYRDIRNLVATDKIVETYSSGTKYSQYINRSFGEVKGITLSFDKRMVDNFSAFVDYTYQVAQGDASDPQSAYNDLRGSNPREPQKQLVPLSWDRRHTINGSVTYMTPGLQNLGVTLLAKYGSGLPYSPVNQGIRTGFENDGRRPSFYNFDLSAFKTFKLSPKAERKLILTLTVLNLLDTKNEDNVYNDTGRAGYSQEELRAVEVIEYNTLKEYYTNPTYYSRPRMVKIGARFEF